MKKQSIVIVAAVVMVLAFVVGASLYRGMQAERVGFLAQENASTLVPDHAPIKGDEDARVYIVEFFDPACETCRVFHAPVERLMAAHPGKLRLVLRYAPFHQGSDVVVKMLEASRKQGKYWETLELMFASQPAWASHHNPQPERLWELLPRAGVDVVRLRADMNDPALDALIEQDLADAATLGARKTPTFFVNGKPLPSFGWEQLQTLVESEVAANYDRDSQ